MSYIIIWLIFYVYINEIHMDIIDSIQLSGTMYTLSAQTSGYVPTSAVTSAVTSGSTDVVTSDGVYQQVGGFKLRQVTQSEYDALVQGGTVDNSTIYYIVN